MNLINKKVYKLAAYYINCKKNNIQNIDFMKKLNILSKKFNKPIFSLLALFIYAKKDIINEAIKTGTYFNEIIFQIPDNLKELNKKNKIKGGN